MRGRFEMGHRRSSSASLTANGDRRARAVSRHDRPPAPAMPRRPRGQPLDEIFGALSDPIRRGIIARLPRPVLGHRARRAVISVSAPAISKHLGGARTLRLDRAVESRPGALSADLSRRRWRSRGLDRAAPGILGAVSSMRSAIIWKGGRHANRHRRRSRCGKDQLAHSRCNDGSAPRPNEFSAPGPSRRRCGNGGVRRAGMPRTIEIDLRPAGNTASK